MQRKHIALLVALCAALICVVTVFFMFLDTARKLKAIDEAPELTEDNIDAFFESAGKNDTAVIKATLTSANAYQGLSGEHCVRLEIHEQSKSWIGWKTVNKRRFDDNRAIVLGLDVTRLLNQLPEQRISYHINPNEERHIYKYIPNEMPVTLYCWPMRDDLGFNARLSAGDVATLKASIIIDVMRAAFIVLLLGVFVYLISMGWYRMLREREELELEDEDEQEPENDGSATARTPRLKKGITGN